MDGSGANSSGRDDRVKLMIGLGLVVSVLFVVLFQLGLTASTPSIRDEAGQIPEESISVLEAVTLGGFNQWISIRGEDASNPILLWLHGGPGSAQMPLAHRLDGLLEEHFVVVHWDQRGAGKSNTYDLDEATLKVDQYLEDAQELVQYLRENLDQDRIFLLGHSWGSELGLRLAASHPEYFYAYIGVSQVVDTEAAMQWAHDWLKVNMRERRDLDGLKALADLGEPPYTHPEYRELIQWVDRYGGNMDWGFWEMAQIGLRAPEYHALDYWRWYRGMLRGGRPLHADGSMRTVDLVADVPELQIPAFFLAGARDANTPLALLEPYVDGLLAPEKEIFVFEDSAHTPFLGETKRFHDVLIRLRNVVLGS